MKTIYLNLFIFQIILIAFFSCSGGGDEASSTSQKQYLSLNGVDYTVSTDTLSKGTNSPYIKIENNELDETVNATVSFRMGGKIQEGKSVPDDSVTLLFIIKYNKIKGISGTYKPSSFVEFIPGDYLATIVINKYTTPAKNTGIYNTTGSFSITEDETNKNQYFLNLNLKGSAEGVNYTIAGNFTSNFKKEESSIVE